MPAACLRARVIRINSQVHLQTVRAEPMCAALRLTCHHVDLHVLPQKSFTVSMTIKLLVNSGVDTRMRFKTFTTSPEDRQASSRALVGYPFTWTFLHCPPHDRTRHAIDEQNGVSALTANMLFVISQI